MRTLFILYSICFDICRFRRAPQELPYSPTLLLVTLCNYTVMSVLLTLSKPTLSEAIITSIADTVLLVAIPSSLLYLTHYPQRVVKTVTALAGTSTLLGFLCLPLVVWIHSVEENGAGLPALILLGIFIWSVIVDAHILKQALAVSFAVALFITVISTLLTSSILHFLFVLPE